MPGHIAGDSIVEVMGNLVEGQCDSSRLLDDVFDITEIYAFVERARSLRDFHRKL
jgi:hypothetical protein